MFFTEALFRFDPEEIFFHAATGCHSLPVSDPWDLSMHDYAALTRGWLKYPPPHLVAGAFVSSSDGSKAEGEHKPSKRRSGGAMTAARRREILDETYTGIQTLGTLGQAFVSSKGLRTPQEQAKVDLSLQLLKLDREGVSLADFPVPWSE